ncbi:TolC family protein [bacterium]|nr:TolC family protein [bacterium]
MRDQGPRPAMHPLAAVSVPLRRRRDASSLTALASCALVLVAGACAANEEGRSRYRLRSALDGSELAVGTARIPGATVAPLASVTLPIDLPTVLALSGEQPNAIRFARERLAEADAQVTAATASLLPSLVVGGSFSRHNGVIQDVAGKFFDTTRQAFFLGGTGEVSLDMGGSIFSYLRERQRREAVAEDLESVTQERIAAAARAYFELVGGEANGAIARETLDHARAFQAIAASRERNKVGLTVDRLRADAEVARARQALIVAEERARIASIRLATILRLDAKVTLYPAEKEVRPITFFSPETAPDQLIATALENHPDLRSAARRVQAADLESDAAHLGPFIPVVRAGVGGLNGGLGYSGAHFGTLEGREDYYAGIELRLTGLGFGEYARAKAAGARLRAETVRADDLRERIIADVLETREVVRARSAAIGVALEELHAADEARKIAEKRLDQGFGLAIEVLAAEEERTRAATHVVDTIVGYNAAQYQLLNRVGERPGR